MKKIDKVKIFKIVATIITIAIIISLIIYLFPVMQHLSTKEGQIAFKNRVDSSGIPGMMILLFLQIMQIFLFIIPGEPIEILAGMCYGSVLGTIFIMISSCITSIIIFLLVRKFERRFVYKFSDKEKIKKIEESKLFQNPKKIEYIMLILFIIPGTPKDLLIYVAGLLPTDFKKFIIISTFARLPSIISSTWAGANLTTGN